MQCGGNQLAMRTFLVRTLSFPAVAALTLDPALTPVENKSYYNFGCAYQRNMAAMVDNPSELMQPRAETPPYTPRRSEAFEKYRKGAPTTTTYPEADKANLSDTGI
jgi:type IV pilus biogenesis protein CpaD/CtpE